MFHEKLTRYYAHDNSHFYMAHHCGTGGRKSAYAQLKELRQFWKDCVDTTNEDGKVWISAYTKVSPVDYMVCINLTDPKNVVLFKLAIPHVDDLPTIIKSQALAA